MEKYGEAFKELSTKKKVQHIWEYYRWHIIAAIIAIAVIGNFVHAVITPAKKFAVDIVVAGKLISDETQPKDIEKFEKEFNTGLSIASVDFANMGQLEMVMMQKIPLLARTKELDILILSEAAYRSYLNQGGTELFRPLDTIEELKPLLEAKKDSLITNKDIEPKNLKTEEDKQKAKKLKEENHIYGIKLDTLNMIPSIKLSEGLVMGVTSTVKDIPKTAEMVNYLAE